MQENNVFHFGIFELVSDVLALFPVHHRVWKNETLGEVIAIPGRGSVFKSDHWRQTKATAFSDVLTARNVTVFSYKFLC